MKKNNPSKNTNSKKENIEQKVQAKFLEKGEYMQRRATVPYAIFELSDGTRHKVIWMHPFFQRKAYKELKENEIGILTYKYLGEWCCFYGFESSGKEEPHQLRTRIPSDTIQNESKSSLLSKLDFGVIFILLMFPIILFVSFYYRLSSGYFFAIFITYVILIAIFSHVKQKKLTAMPEQKIKAAVAKKINSCIIFQLEDKTTKKISVPTDILTTLITGDTGMLTFKERKKDTMFIDFERDVY